MTTVPSPIATVVPEQPIVYEEAPVIAEAPVVAETPVETPPVVPIAAPAKGFGCGKVIVATVVILVLLIVAFLFIFSNLPSVPVASNPVGSSPTGNNVTPPVTSAPVASQPLVSYMYAGIGSDGTIRTFAANNSETVISLDQKNYQSLQISPNRRFVSSLGGSSAVSDDKNLYLYDLTTAKWEALTVFDKGTTGINGYFWVGPENILFVQGGWLHELNISSRGITKLFKAAGTLVAVDNSSKRLMFRASIDWDLPSGKKTDYVFLIANFSGEAIRTIKLEDLVSVDGGLALVDVYFGPENKVIAELVGFDQATKYQKFASRLFVLDGTEKREITLPTELKPQIIGVINEALVFSVVESNRLITLGEVDLNTEKIIAAAYPPPLSSNQVYKSATVSLPSLIGFNYTEGSGSSELTLWYNLGERSKPLEPVEIKTSLRELVTFPAI